jgi:hypothetical protein
MSNPQSKLDVPLPADVKNRLRCMARDRGVATATLARQVLMSFIRENKPGRVARKLAERVNS